VAGAIFSWLSWQQPFYFGRCCLLLGGQIGHAGGAGFFQIGGQIVFLCCRATRLGITLGSQGSTGRQAKLLAVFTRFHVVYLLQVTGQGFETAFVADQAHNLVLLNGLFGRHCRGSLGGSISFNRQISFKLFQHAVDALNFLQQFVRGHFH